jgi:hypothetical protein
VQQLVAEAVVEPELLVVMHRDLVVVRVVVVVLVVEPEQVVPVHQIVLEQTLLSCMQAVEEVAVETQVEIVEKVQVVQVVVEPREVHPELLMVM